MDHGRIHSGAHGHDVGTDPRSDVPAFVPETATSSTIGTPEDSAQENQAGIPQMR